jgi:hypothetical protein
MVFIRKKQWLPFVEDSFLCDAKVDDFEDSAAAGHDLVRRERRWAGRRISFNDLTAAGKLLYELVGLVAGAEGEEGPVEGLHPAEDVELLIQWFVKREEENMALYSYINELSNTTSEIEVRKTRYHTI